VSARACLFRFGTWANVIFIHRFTTRQAKEDFEYQGIKYKAGTCIMSPVFVIHMDERFFPDPTKFDPDRFSEGERRSYPEVCFP
ncbi:cytochrome P450, putative, partial [Ixodes scapularis]